VLPCVDVFVADEFCVWATILRTCLVFLLGAHLADVPCFALRWGAQLADVRTGLVFALQTCIELRWGTQLADVPCVAFGRPSCGRSLRCVWAPILRTCVLAPNLRTCLALRWGAQLTDVPCVALGCPTCGRALCCVWSPILQGKICSYQSSSSSLSLVLPCVDVLVADEFCVWATILRMCLALRWGAQLVDVWTGLVFALRTCVVVSNLRTCLALRWGAQLAMKFRVSVYDRNGKSL
jgi:uncharacterized membrane protein YqaE (UPF0057 family)